MCAGRRRPGRRHAACGGGPRHGARRLLRRRREAHVPRAERLESRFPPRGGCVRRGIRRRRDDARRERGVPRRVQPLVQLREARHGGGVASVVRVFRIRHVLGSEEPAGRGRDGLLPLHAALRLLQFRRTQPLDVRRVRVVRADRDESRHPRGGQPPVFLVPLL